MPTQQRRTNQGAADIPHPAKPASGRTCDLCGQPTPAGERQQALVGTGAAGRRIVTACGPDHLQLLIDQARDAQAAGHAP